MRWVLLLSLAACGRISFDGVAGVGAGDDAGGSDGSLGSDGSDGGPMDQVGVVQSKTVSTAFGASSAMVTFDTKPVAGHMIVITAASFDFMATSSLEATSAADGGSGQIAMAIFENTTNNCFGGGISVAIYASLATAATTGVVTVTPQPVRGQEVAITATEYSGITAIDDVSSFITPTATGSPHLVRSGQTDPPSTSSDVAVAVGTDCSGAPGALGFTDLETFDSVLVETDASQHVASIHTRKLLTTADPVEDRWNIAYSGLNAGGLGAIATFR